MIRTSTFGDVNGLDQAAVAALLANRARVAIIDALLDGSEHPVGGLARAAGVSPSTSAEHVARLERGGLVASRRVGRRRLVRIARPSVARAYEGLSGLSIDPEPSSLRAWTLRAQLRAARTCYDHVAGALGVALTDAALAAGALERDFTLGPSAEAWFGAMGVELDTLRRNRRPLIRTCLDWTERREHLSGALGAALCAALLQSGWAIRRPSSRALVVTELGDVELRRLGLERPTPPDMSWSSRSEMTTR
jgi:DNA-binding transcriptional ArsR family regulator